MTGTILAGVLTLAMGINASSPLPKHRTKPAVKRVILVPHTAKENLAYSKDIRQHLYRWVTVEGE